MNVKRGPIKRIFFQSLKYVGPGFSKSFCQTFGWSPLRIRTWRGRGIIGHYRLKPDALDCWLGTWGSYTLGEHSRYIEKVIKPTSKPQRSNYIFCLFEAYPTELSGLDDALDEVPDDYYAWLMSNSYKEVLVNILL